MINTLNVFGIRFLLVLISIGMLGGCTKLLNWTAKEFPWDRTEDGPDLGKHPLHDTTSAVLFELANPPSYQFLLETKSGVGDINSVEIWVDGSLYPMERVPGSHVWQYTDSDACPSSDSYQYYMRVKHTTIGPLWEKTAYIGSPEKPYKAIVGGFDELVWYLPGWSDAFNDDGQVNVASNISVVVENRSPGFQRKITGIGFPFGDSDASEFSIENKFPPLDAANPEVILDCGDKFRFDVKWLDSDLDNSDETTLTIFSWTKVGSTWVRDTNPLNITVKGYNPG